MSGGNNIGKINTPIPEEERDKTNKTLTRREFVAILGAGLAITGYCLGGIRNTEIPKTKSDANGNASLPRLRKDLVFHSDDGFNIIRLRSGGDLTFGVNDVGQSVLQRMDGRHSVEDIAGFLSREFGIPADEALKANVALFAAQIGTMGLLQEPFHVTIFERANS